MSSNAVRFTLYALDQFGTGKPGPTLTSITRAEHAAIIWARREAEKPGSAVERIVVVDGDGTTVASVLVTALAEVAA